MTASSEKSKTAAAKPSVAQELIDLASNECYFEGPNGRAYATVQLEEYGDRRFTVPLKSSRYKNWLANLYFAATGNVASSHAKTDAISILTQVHQFRLEKRPILAVSPYAVRRALSKTL